MPVLDEDSKYEYGWEDPRLEGMLVEMMEPVTREDRVKALSERQRDARRAALHEWAAKAKVGEYSRSVHVPYDEQYEYGWKDPRKCGPWRVQPRTDWRHRLGQWLIRVGKRVCSD